MADLLSKFTFENIANLRGLLLDKIQENNMDIAEGIYLSWDDLQASVLMKVKSGPDEILQINAEISGSPRWVSLNFSLGSSALIEGSSLVMVLRGSSDCRRTMSAFLRSKIGEQVFDFDFANAIDLSESEFVSVLLCQVRAREGIVEDCFRTLVIKLPCENFSICINDLRLFTVLPRLAFDNTEPTLSFLA